MQLPTAKKIQCCAEMGWDYLGDGLFTNGDLIGWFTEKGFHKESAEN